MEAALNDMEKQYQYEINELLIILLLTLLLTNINFNIWQVIFNPKLSVYEAFYNHPASHLTKHYSQAPHTKSYY